MPYLAAHAVPGYPAVLRVPNMGKAETLTENWHFDSAYFEDPPPIAILAAQELPESAATRCGPISTSPTTRCRRRCRSCCPTCGRRSPARCPTTTASGTRSSTYHPIVRTHPATGRQSLAIGRIESVPHFEGMTPRRAADCSSSCTSHAARPEFVYRHRWRDGDVVMWDNRCLLHYAVHDYGDADTTDAPRDGRRSLDERDRA